jgi:hypothetical protein
LVFTNFVEKIIVFVRVISFIQVFGLRMLIPRYQMLSLQHNI